LNQQSLYRVIDDSGFRVLEFADHPGSFGSWYIIFDRGHNKYRASYDGRDQSLAFSIRNHEDWSDIENVDCNTMSEHDCLMQLQQFLARQTA
jgi:hypothetical protein